MENMPMFRSKSGSWLMSGMVSNTISIMIQTKGEVGIHSLYDPFRKTFTRLCKLTKIFEV